jgi:FKBP-type peptidyl-prolyl cis-trans isomerase
MKKHNLKGIKTKNGAYVVLESPGDASLKADSGKLASVMYRGYLQSNGKVFDTNMDTTKGHTDPIQVPVGSRNSIQGWNDALPYFGKGGKGKILVPAMLAYGPQAQGADIPAFSNLVFDVVITDVQDMPKTSGNPMQDYPQGDEQQQAPQK